MRVYGRGAGALRVCLGVDELSLLVLDGQGAPVLSIDSIQARPVDQSQIEAARRRGHEALFELRWRELPVASADS